MRLKRGFCPLVVRVFPLSRLCASFALLVCLCLGDARAQNPPPSPEAPAAPATPGVGETKPIPKIRPVARPKPATPMQRALAMARRGDYVGATAVAPTPAAKDLIMWLRLRDGRGSLAEAQNFMATHADWPGQDRIKARAESKVSGSDAETVVTYFDGDLPQTSAGVMALIKAHLARDEIGDAQAVAVLSWRTRTLTAAAETELLEMFPELLPDHNVARLDDLIWRGKREAAARMYPRTPEGYEALAKARFAFQVRSGSAEAALNAVPKERLDDPGLAFEQFNAHARSGRNAKAISLLEQWSTGPDDLGRPEKWANWRRIFARMKLREGFADQAYRLSSQHYLVEGSNFADLEWLSGFIALRYLDDPELALLHFDRFREAVETPISLGRAGYWRGRAYRVLGNDEAAKDAFEFGAKYQTSFYGQLAAEELGLPLDPLMSGVEAFPPLAETSLNQRSLFQAGKLLIENDERDLAEWLLTELTAGISRSQAGTLGAWLLDKGETHIALKVAKKAARNGYMLAAPYYPLHEVKNGPWPVPPELTLAIARRESEFDPVVRSPAGALGLMQLMPGTARDVSKELGIGYSKAQLTADPTYNARLGTAYLDGLIEIFGYSPVLVSIGYNAGPGRSVRWVNDRGDPRDAGINVIDWIELIPFRETRNYVMRVTESLPVYRARLSGQTGEIGLKALLRGAFPVDLPTKPRARPANLAKPKPTILVSTKDKGLRPKSRPRQ